MTEAPQVKTYTIHEIDEAMGSLDSIAEVVESLADAVANEIRAHCRMSAEVRRALAEEAQVESFGPVAGLDWAVGALRDAIREAMTSLGLKP